MTGASVLRAVVVTASVLAAAASSAGQGAAPAPAIPRTADGRPNLAGVWQVLSTAAWDIQAHQARKGIPGGLGVVVGGELPYQPWAAEKQRENFRTRATADPETKCYQPGVPRLMYMPYPFQILQSSTQVLMLFEYIHSTRTVYTNGSRHPEGPINWWLGDSRGRWEGDTLVVDTVHFTDQTWFDRAGNFHSEDLHLVERYTLTDRDHITYEVDVEDPKVFTRPWKLRLVFYRHVEPEAQLLDYECYGFDVERYYP